MLSLSILVAVIPTIAHAPMIIDLVESMDHWKVISGCMVVAVWMATTTVTTSDHQLLMLILQRSFLILADVIAKHLAAEPAVVGVMLKIGIGIQVMVEVERTLWAVATTIKVTLVDLAWFKYLGYNVV